MAVARDSLEAEPRPERSTGVLQPCRAYRPGEHARWLRGRLTRSMLIAAVGGGIASAVLALAVAYAASGLPGLPATIVGWSAVLVFPLVFFVVHWVTIGPRRWAAIELVMWAGRIDAANFLEATGMTDPTDAVRGAQWLASHPPFDGEDPSITYWRAYIHLVLDEPAAARRELSRLPHDPDWERDRGSLAAQIDLAEGHPAQIGRLEALVEAMSPSEERAVGAVENGALRSQVAWSCGEDDVAPVLAARPMVEGRAAGTLLRHYWLPLGLMTLLTWAGITLLLSLLG